jgi:hypothetical protein
MHVVSCDRVWLSGGGILLIIQQHRSDIKLAVLYDMVACGTLFAIV